MFFISIIEIQDFFVSRDIFNEKTNHTWSLQFRFSSSYFHYEFYKLIFTIFYLNINLRKYIYFKILTKKTSVRFLHTTNISIFQNNNMIFSIISTDGFLDKLN